MLCCHLFTTAPSPPKLLSITRIMKAEIELNWLSPTEPNGEVHYVIYYTPEGGTEQSIDSGSNLTHYNLTGLESNRVYTDIAVRAVNSAGTSVSSTVILQYNHMPDGGELCIQELWLMAALWYNYIINMHFSCIKSEKKSQRAP